MYNQVSCHHIKKAYKWTRDNKIILKETEVNQGKEKKTEQYVQRIIKSCSKKEKKELVRY